MPTPSIVGSMATVGFSDATTDPRVISFTVATGCDCIAVMVSSWDSTAAPTVTGITLINGGANPAFTSQIQNDRAGSYQNSEIWTLTDSHADWPGIGTFDIQIDFIGYTANFQVTATAQGLQDTDPTTPVSAVTTGTMDGNSTDSQISLTSATDELILGVVTHYDGAADAYSVDQTDIYTQTPAGMDSNHFQQVGAVSASVGVTFPATQAWSTVAASFQDVAAGPETITINSGSLALTGSNIGTSPPFVSDTFDGTGALGSHWLPHQDDGRVSNIQRQSGYFDGDVLTNPGNITEWFNTLSGTYHYQTVEFPSSGFDEYIIRGVGVGPTATPQGDLVSSGGYAFTGVMCHVDNGFSSLDYEFAVIGHRGGTVATVESKSTLAGVSQVADEGANVFTGTGVTHGDIRIRLYSDNTIEFAYSDLGADSWTLINGGTGDTPGTGAQKPTFGNTVHIGPIIYAEGTAELPFTGSIDSFEFIPREIDIESGSLVLAGSNIDTLYNRLMVSESGSFLLTGSNIDTLFNRVSAIDSGSFALTGSNINTNYVPIGPSISLDSGSFALTGSSLNSLVNRVASIVSGSLNLNGSNIDTNLTLITDIESGTFILTGSNVQSLYNQISVLESGAFTLNGSNITTRVAGVSDSIIDIQLIHSLANKILLKRVRND